MASASQAGCGGGEGGGQCIRCLFALNVLAPPYLPGTQLPQEPSLSLCTDGETEAWQGLSLRSHSRS